MFCSGREKGTGKREKGTRLTQLHILFRFAIRLPQSRRLFVHIDHLLQKAPSPRDLSGNREKGKGDTADAAANPVPLRNPPSSKRAAFCTHSSSAPKGSLSEGAVSRSLTEGVLPVQLNPCVKSMICPGPLFPAACCLFPVPSSPRSPFPVPCCLLPVPSSPGPALKGLLSEGAVSRSLSEESSE